MEEILSKLSSFVASKDSRLACAAAVILSELAPRNTHVVKHLADALQTADPVRRPFIIEALGRIGTPDAAAALVPLIKSEGSASENALRAIAHAPAAALKPLLKLVGTVPPALLERIAECAARTGEPAAFSTLLSGLKGADVDTCRAVRNGLRTAMSSFDEWSKENLHKELERSFKTKDLTQHFPSLIALMKISGDLGDIRLQNHLVEHIDERYPPHVRRPALQALAMLHYTGPQRARLAPKLLPLMIESDVANIAEPALDAIRQAQLGSEHQAQLKKLLNSPSSRIREFGMQALATQGSGRNISDLIECLDNPDRSVREEALGALSRAPSAATPLCTRLIEIEGGEPALETARALTPQASKVPHKLLESLADQYVTLATRNGRRKPAEADELRKLEDKRRAILSVFRASNTPELVGAVFSRARKLRQDDPHRAYEMMKNVVGLSGWNDDYRVELALAGISFGPRDLSRAARSSDQNLRVLDEMLASARKSPKDMLKLVRKEFESDRKTLYYLGFHFVERLQNERDFGRLVLEHLSESRSDEGRQAREKLVIEGLATIKGARAGILEERAKVMLAPSDMLQSERLKADKRKPAKAKVKAKAKAVRAKKKR